MDYKKEIIKTINDMSGSRSPYEVFCDWVKCSALAIQNQLYIFHKDELWKKREDQYLQTVKAYGKDAALFGDMFAMLSMALEENMTDVLGEVYMEAGLGNKNTGQFFTPFHVSYLSAKLSIGERDGSRPITMNEPSCGAGGMIIATAKALLDRGINYQRCLDVVAQDLDWKAVYMCYVQTSLLGIRAVVVQGDTLANPYIPGRADPECVFFTPKYIGAIL